MILLAKTVGSWGLGLAAFDQIISALPAIGLTAVIATGIWVVCRW